MGASRKAWVLAAVVAGLIPVAAQGKADLHARIMAAYEAEVSPAYLPDGVETTERLYRQAADSRTLRVDDKARAALLYASAVWEKGDAKAPLKLATEAVALLKHARADDTALMGHALRDMSVYQSGGGDVAGSLDTKQQALVLLRRHYGDTSPQVGATLCSIAHAQSLLGRLGEALRHYDDGLALMRADVGTDGKFGDPGNFSAYLGNYAGQLRVAGDAEKALVISREALQVAYQMPEGDRAVSWGMFNIASSLLDLGRFAEAEDLYRQALDYSVRYGGKTTAETGSYTSSLGRALARQGKDEEAEAMLQAAVSILEQVQTGSSPYLLGVNWEILGQLAYERGDTGLSEDRLRKALDILTKLGARSRPQTANTRSDLALVLLAKHDLPEALKEVDQALVYYRAEKPDHEKTRVAAETLHALILARMGDTETALREATVMADVMEARLNSLTATTGDHADAALLYGRSFTRIADVAVSANRPELAFRAAQLAAFTEVAATSRALAARSASGDSAATVLIGKIETLRQARQRLDKARIFAIGKSPDQAAQLSADITAADAELARLDGELFTVFPDYRRLSQPRPVTISQAQAQLSSRTAIVLPLSGDDRTTSVVLTRKGMAWDQAPMARTAVADAVVRIRASANTSASIGASDETPFDRGAAQELGQAIFTPKILKALKRVEEIEVTGAGPVMAVPFGLLIARAPKQGVDAVAMRETPWLIRSFAVSVRSALDTTASGHRSRQGGFAGIGAPLGTPAEPGLALRSAALRPLPQLPHAEAELHRMGAVLNLPQTVVLTGDAATEARLRALPLQQYSVLAFATHGLVSGDLLALREPALVMTQGEGGDGLLTASEIAGLPLDADWIILSACNTGSGREAGAAGYSGLAKAFLQAGGRNVLVSLWPVRDDAASAISVDTVRAYARGSSEASALRHATLKFMNDKTIKGSDQPGVWAPFSLVTR